MEEGRAHKGALCQDCGTRAGTERAAFLKPCSGAESAAAADYEKLEVGLIWFDAEEGIDLVEP
jgi:hypothetical protein